jgi:hypothetical protein
MMIRASEPPMKLRRFMLRADLDRCTTTPQLVIAHPAEFGGIGAWRDFIFG